MTIKEKLLAAEILDQVADEYSNHGCNDWDFPEEWTAEEKIKFVREFHEFDDSLDEFNPAHLGMADYWVMKLLAHKIRKDVL